MDIIGKEKLIQYAEIHPNARSSIEDWIVVMETSQFKTTQELKKMFSSVSFLPKAHCIFNINGNHHRLFVKVVYVAGKMIVKWIGTHAEYDKKDFNKLAQGE
ncbi:type II toxin-antitoxin system HigB family toxin [Pasteurella sp. PK-2025]|uniref:type II toxin-antitoxin system HigB family toxin n=1 Tax=Pasteurella sp. PK-2025 TaxID=3413133 RepID=UPI003C735497